MQNRWMLKGALVVGLAVSLSACGDDSLSEEDSQKGFAATQLALQQGAAGAQTSNPAALTVIDGFEFGCLGGGTAIYKGEFDEDTDSGNFIFNYDVTFNGCVSNGVTLDGDMSYNFDVTSNDMTGDFDLKYSFIGNVDFSGDVDGSCEMDLTMQIAGGQTGGTFSYSGSVCGNDADSTFSGSYSVPQG